MKTYKQIEQRVSEEFWKMLDGSRFIKSQNSFNGEIEHHEGGVEDQEAVIKINGDFDKYEIDNFLTQYLKQAILDFYEEVVPERMEGTKSYIFGRTPDIDNYIAGEVAGNQQAIDQLNLNKQRYFEE
jgi:hypothetical protein